MSSLRARSFGSLLTFTRSSTASYVNSQGLIATAAANEPRIDYDPVARTRRGLLLEDARTNLLLRSQDWSASWTQQGANISAAAITAPDGAVTGTWLSENSATSTHGYYQSVTKAGSSITYSLSLYVKAATRSRLYLGIARSGETAYAWAKFNLGAGTTSKGTSGAGFTAGNADLVAAGNGWYRVTFSAATDSDTTVIGIIRLVNGVDEPNYAGDGASGLYIWGAQLEVGDHPTSYIPTTTAAATRTAETCQLSAPTALLNQAAGSLVCELWLPWAHADGTFRRLVEITGGNDGTYVEIVSGAGYAETRIDSATTSSLSLGAITKRAVAKLAVAWAENDVAAVATGGSVQSDTSHGIANGQTTVSIGEPSLNLNGHLRRVRFYPRRLTNSELLAAVA